MFHCSVAATLMSPLSLDTRLSISPAIIATMLFIIRRRLPLLFRFFSLTPDADADVV